MSNDIRLAYVTGIKSYGSANTFEDITYDPEFMTLYGSTEEEVYNMAIHYSPYTPLSSTEIDELKQCYGGYSWDLSDTSDHRNTTFNSYLIQKYFSSGRSKQPYWINSSSQSIYNVFPTLSSLILPVNITTLSLKKQYDPFTADNGWSEECMARAMIEAGYATITRVYPTGEVEVGYPNDEIRHALAEDFKSQFLSKHSPSVVLLKTTLQQGNISAFITCCNSLRALLTLKPGVPGVVYMHESNWVAVLYQLLQVACVPCDLGGDSNSLEHSDVMFIVNETVYIVKFKLITEALSTPAYATIATDALTSLQSVENREYEESAFVQSHLHTAAGIVEEGVKDVIYISLLASTIDKRYVTMAMQSTRGVDKTVEIIHFKPVE